MWGFTSRQWIAAVIVVEATCSSRLRTGVSSYRGIRTSAPRPQGGLHSASWGYWWGSERCRLSASRRHIGRSSGNARRRKDGRPTPTLQTDVYTRVWPGRRRTTRICRRRSLRQEEGFISILSNVKTKKPVCHIFLRPDVSRTETDAKILSHWWTCVSPTDVIVLCQPTVSPTVTHLLLKVRESLGSADIQLLSPWKQ